MILSAFSFCLFWRYKKTNNTIIKTITPIRRYMICVCVMIRCEVTHDFSRERNRTGTKTSLPATPTSLPPFCLLCDCAVPSGIPLYANFPTGRELFTAVMTLVSLLCLRIPVLVDKSPARLLVPKDGDPHRCCSAGFERIRHFPLLSGMLNRMLQSPGLVEYPRSA